MVTTRSQIMFLATGLFLLSTICYSEGACNAKYCSKCDAKAATCQTENTTEVIPQDIPSARTITKLKVDYRGTTQAVITLKDMANFTNLKELTIRGNISNIERDSFNNLKDLEILTITETQITKLPNSLLPPASSLLTLNLPRNKLEQIPLGIFNQIQGINTLDLSGNCMNITSCTLGDEFGLLSSLTELRLAGITMVMCNKTFRNVSAGLKVLNLANSSISLLDPALLSRFQQLEHLDISHVETFAKCPHNASLLFQHLPQNLTSISMRRWGYIEENSTCFLTAEDMDPFRRFPNLTKLDFFSSDLIFGSNINKELFKNLTSLTELDLSWCRISQIEPHSFESNRNLETLILDGNLVGSRYINLQGENFSSTIKNLSLRRTGLVSDDSQVFHPVSKLINVNLTKIDLSGNFLRQSPLFDVREDGIVKFYEPWCIQKQPWERDHNISSEYRPNLTTVILNNNKIKRFIPVKRQRLGLTHCKQTPNFIHLEMEDNNLKELEGLCESLKVVRLRNNDLNLAWNGTIDGISNSRVLRHHPGLPHVEELDLSDNDLSYIPWNLFVNMQELRVLRLSHNDITELPSNLSFVNNTKLEIIDLSWNALSYFDYKLIQKLPNLRELILNDNLITEFEEEFFEAIGNQSNKNFIRKVNILRNPIRCDCDHLYVKEWINKETPGVRLVGAKELRCSTPGKGERTVHDYDYDVNNCRGIIALYAILGILGVAGLTALIAWPCYKYKWYVKHPKIVLKAFVKALRSAKLEHEVEYDAFLSYDHKSDSDIDYIIETLLPALETSQDRKELKLYVYHREMTPGALMNAELAEAMSKSRKIIILMSNSYIKSGECKFEAGKAVNECFGAEFYQPHKILVLVKEALDDSVLDAPITSLLTETVINLFRESSDKEKENVWARVRKFINKPKYEYKRRARKGISMKIFRRAN